MGEVRQIPEDMQPLSRSYYAGKLSDRPPPKRFLFHHRVKSIIPMGELGVKPLLQGGQKLWNMSEFFVSA